MSEKMGFLQWWQNGQEDKAWGEYRDNNNHFGVDGVYFWAQKGFLAGTKWQREQGSEPSLAERDVVMKKVEKWCKKYDCHTVALNVVVALQSLLALKKPPKEGE